MRIPPTMPTTSTPAMRIHALFGSPCDSRRGETTGGGSSGLTAGISRSTRSGGGGSGRVTSVCVAREYGSGVGADFVGAMGSALAVAPWPVPGIVGVTGGSVFPVGGASLGVDGAGVEGRAAGDAASISASASRSAVFSRSTPFSRAADDPLSAANGSGAVFAVCENADELADGAIGGALCVAVPGAGDGAVTRSDEAARRASSMSNACAPGTDEIGTVGGSDGGFGGALSVVFGAGADSREASPSAGFTPDALGEVSFSARRSFILGSFIVGCSPAFVSAGFVSAGFTSAGLG